MVLNINIVQETEPPNTWVLSVFPQTSHDENVVECKVSLSCMLTIVAAAAVFTAPELLLLKVSRATSFQAGKHWNCSSFTGSTY